MLHDDLSNVDFSFLSKRMLELTGIHLSDQKINFMRVRLRPRLVELELEDFQSYRKYLESLPSSHPEWQLMINQLTTNKTNFFREREHFDFLVKDFLPKWEKRSNGRKLMVWSAVCSTGEEPYTIAMVLDRYFNGADRFQVFASDVDTKALDNAANGVYQKSLLIDIPTEFQSRSLVMGKGNAQNWFKINDRIHERIKFLPHNLIKKELPFQIAFDVIFCRNVFIYFRSHTIEQIANYLHNAASADSVLLIGHTESLTNLKQPWKYQSPSIFSKSSEAQIEKKQSTPVILRAIPKAKAPPPLPKRESPDLPATVSIPKISLVKRKRVLVVDDSPTITKLLSDIFKQDPDLEVVGVINKPREVENALHTLKPDVMTLDINMPEMDGCAVLKQVMGKYPIPTVIVSSLSLEEGSKVLQALELGAIDYIQKPSFAEIKSMTSIIIEKVKDAALAKVRVHKASANRKGSAKSRVATGAFGNLIAIGSSTGGTEALRMILTELPPNIPPIVIVQHIPPVFSKAFALRLNELCPFEVKEAEDGDVLRNNLVLIAPGGIHMVLQPRANSLIVRLDDSPPVNRHKPSVDPLFNSVAQIVGSNAVGVVLTGMGGDGSKGLLKMRLAGARTIAQDEESSVVFGMPKEAIRLGAAEQIRSLSEIPGALVNLMKIA